MDNKTKLKNKMGFIKFIFLVIIGIFVIFSIYIGNLYIQGKKYKENGNYEEAIKYYSKVSFINKSIKNDINECYYKEAIELRNNKEFESSINIFNKIEGYQDTQEQLKQTRYEYGIYDYQKGKIVEAQKYLEEFNENPEIQEYLKDIHNLLKLQGVWKDENSVSVIRIKDNIMESYSSFGYGKSSLYKYALGNGSSRYFKVTNRSGKIKLDGNKIRIYENDKEISGMNYEWNEETNNIVSDRGSIIEDVYIKSEEEIKEVEAIKEPTIGMTKTEVENSTWGKPKDINKTTTKYGTREQWVYSGNRYIYFENGVVTSIQE